MEFFKKMERKFGKFAISNLPLYMVIIYGFGYFMNTLFPNWIYFVSLNPGAILHGQVWRVVSWVLVPDQSFLTGGIGIFLLLIAMFFYYSVARTLELTWGKFMFNLYIFTGIFITVIGAFVLYIYYGLVNPPMVAMVEQSFASYGPCTKALGGSWFNVYLSSNFSTIYLYLSIFLAYAMTYPNERVLLYFFIPIKVKILGIIYLITIAFDVAVHFTAGFDHGLMVLVVVVSSLFNFFLFYFLLKKSKKARFKELRRQKEFKKKVKEAEQPASQIRHKCAVCGQTDVSNPSLTFRYCSKCNGNYEYCNEHLFTHKHID